MSAKKLGSIRTCEHCRCWIRLVSIRGSVVWAHTPGQGTRCAKARANKAERAKAEQAKAELVKQEGA